MVAWRLCRGEKIALARRLGPWHVTPDRRSCKWLKAEESFAQSIFVLFFCGLDLGAELFFPEVRTLPDVYVRNEVVAGCKLVLGR